jgi:hypothetical protein
VLIVHGIGHGMAEPEQAVSGYSQLMQDGLAGGLGLSRTESNSTHFPISNNGVRLGTLVRTDYANPNATRRLTFYELSWAEAVKPIKTILLEIDGAQDYRETAPIEKVRAKFNSIGKAFVNTHLADAIIYSGEFGATLRIVVANAVCILTRISPPTDGSCDFRSPRRKPAPIAVITESLGSALVFDTLNELFIQSRERASAAVQVAGATSQMYMFANQLPFFELRHVKMPTDANWLEDYPCPKRDPAEAGSPGTTPGLSGFIELRRLARSPEESTGAESQPLSVVAFSDPNDLLTYFLSERFKNHCADVRFANVTVTNADKLWLFLAADPIRAHSHYRENAEVIRMVLEGSIP